MDLNTLKDQINQANTMTPLSSNDWHLHPEQQKILNKLIKELESWRKATLPIYEQDEL